MNAPWHTCGLADPGRRAFLRTSASGGGGLVVALTLLPLAGCDGALAPEAAAQDADTPLRPSAYLRIDPDGRITVTVDKSEMGQGVHTGLPMLLADELDADFAMVNVEMADTDPEFGEMVTGGSTSVRRNAPHWRTTGAAARALLIAAAAEMWGVPAKSLRTERGAVVNPADGTRLGYGALAGRAARLPLPRDVGLKEPAQQRLIGRPLPRTDLRPKVDGSAVFGLDVQRPGLLTAVVVRCPTFGGRVRRVDESAARAVAGVRAVVNLGDRVGVVADGYWPARKAASELAVEWDRGENAEHDDAWLERVLTEGAQEPGALAQEQGDIAAALEGGELIEATYRLPFQAHVCMEPMNCTAEVREDACVVYAPTQSQSAAQQAAARVAGLKPEQVRVHTTYLGGGFGRRFEVDFVEDAVALSKAVSAPVKVIWSREDDVQHDYYRPASLHRLRGAVADGRATGWWQRVVSPSISARFGASGIDRAAVDGLRPLPYAVPAQHVEYVERDLGVPVGYWRSVGNSVNAFVVEGFIDELAHAAGKDPLAFRLDLLADARDRKVLETAARAAGWGEPLPDGHGRGLAVFPSYGSHVAQVVEAAVDEKGRIAVQRVVCAVDCGQVVNPDQVEAQMEGSIIYALSAALNGEIHLTAGGVRESNFHDYPLPRLADTPQVEVHLVRSDAPFGGVGEPGVPPLAPALANAVYAATGQRLRRLPLRLDAPTARAGG